MEESDGIYVLDTSSGRKSNATMIELTTCPHAGVICVPCQYAIPTNDDKYTIARQIGKHEAKTHYKVSNIKEREAFEEKFEDEMKDFACTIKDTERIDPEKASQDFLGRVGIITDYPYCTECDKLVHTDSRCIKNHGWACAESRSGVTSKNWTRNSPKIIACDKFNVMEPTYWCRTFKKYMNDATIITAVATNDGHDNHHKSIALQLILQQQSDQYESAKLSTTVSEVEQNLTPNMWILHTGWDKILKSYQYCSIFQFVNEKPNDNEQPMLDALSLTLHNMIEEVQEIEPTHQIMSEVQRRTKYQDLNSRFPFYAFKEESTWEKYFRTIKKIFLVMIRLMEKQSNNNNDITVNVPTVKFTKTQLDCYAAIKQCQLPDSHVRSMIYIDFLISLVDQPIQNIMKTVPLLTVLAMISIKDDDSMADAIGTTPVLAAIIGVYKVIFITKSIQCFEVADGNDHSTGDVNDGSNDNDNENENDSSNNNESNWVKRLHGYVGKHFFVNDYGIVHSPITVLIKIFHYGKQIARTATAVGTIRWENDTVIHRDVSISMTQYRSSIRGGIEHLKTSLLSILRLDNSNCLPSIPWNDIVDDQTNNTPHYSFVTEPRNQQWLGMSNHTKAMSDRLSSEIIRDGTDKTINIEFMNQYDKEIGAFRKLLLVMMHVTGGQPARGTEITNLTFVNTWFMPRNISMYRGLVCFCTTYHKSMTHTGKLKRIFRYLPEPVGEALVYYLWLVLPIWERIKGSTIDAKVTSPHLWSKQVATTATTVVKTKKRDLLSTETLSQGLSSLFRINKINVRVYRQLSVAIARRFLKQDWATSDDEIDDDFGDNAEDVVICNDILDLQAAHTSETSYRLYGRGSNENRTTYQGNMDDYYECSIQHHNFILNQNAFTSISTTSTKTNTLVQLQEQLYRQQYYKKLQEDRLMSLVSHDLEQSLQQFTKNYNSKFRGNQRCTIEAILNRHSMVLQIAGAGVGKSMSFLLPAYMSSFGGTTIVVVPLISLQQNLLARCIACNISASIWNGTSFPNPSKIVLVSPESVTSSLFMDYINMIMNERMLDRIVLDECHMYLASHNDYRPNMMNVSNFIHMHSVQTVLLTATLPPNCQSQLFQKLDLDEESAMILRDTTIRKNIRYEVCRIGTQKWLHHVEAILNEPRFHNQRIIIYVLTIRDGEMIANTLALPFYYAKAVNKKTIMDLDIFQGLF